MTVGCSEYTPAKEQYFKTILTAHISASRAVINKHDWTERDYLYIDATAGSGLIEGTITGSPLIFLDYARSFYNWKAVLIEEQKSTYKKLLGAIDERYAVRDEKMTTYHGSYVDYIQALKSNSAQIGLLYVDPNGLIDIDAIRVFSQKMQRMEILLSVGATSIKRVNGSPLLDNVYRFRDLLTMKRYAHIREPYGRNQWTFLMLSNTPIIKEYKSINLRSVTSEEGACYLRTVDNTRTELDEINQPTLPELSGVFETSDLSSDSSAGRSEIRRYL